MERGAVSPLREVWTIAWPTVLTMTSYTLMQFADKIMVAQVGPVQFTAQSNGGIWAFNALAFAMGVLTVINTFVSQNLGAGTPRNGPRYAWAGLWMSVAMWLFVMIPYGLMLPMLFSHLPEHSPELQHMETGYGQILLGGSVLLLAARAMNQYFFGMHRPKVVTIAAITGNLVNVIGNYILIYGSDGVRVEFGGRVFDLPGTPGVTPLGVYGAAIATVIGTAFELGIPFAIFLSKKWNDQYGTRAAWRPDWRAIRDLLRIGWPAAVQWGNELVCWSIFMTVLVGRFGEEHMAAGWIALGYMHLSFMPAVGFSTAVTSLVGRYIGAGQPDVAAARARLGLRLAMGWMTFCGISFFVFRHTLVRAFIGHDVDPVVAERIMAIGSNLLICAAVFQTFDAFGIIYSGALRGAGDTVWPGVITMIYSWVILTLGGWLMVKYAPGLTSIGPWIAASVYIIMFGMTMWQRWAGGRWRSIKLLHRPGDDAARMAPVTAGPPESNPVDAIEDMAEPIAEAVRD